ncbi:unnamed protein product, partial [Laminaria digitata]
AGEDAALCRRPWPIILVLVLVLMQPRVPRVLLLLLLMLVMMVLMLVVMLPKLFRPLEQGKWNRLLNFSKTSANGSSK